MRNVVSFEEIAVTIAPFGGARGVSVDNVCNALVAEREGRD